MLTGKSQLVIRDYRRRDHLDQLTALMQECFPAEKWLPDDVVKFATKTGNILKVLVDDANLLHGAIFYTGTKDECHIRRVAVPTELHKQGIGTYLITHLTGPRSHIRKRVFVARVREHNVPAQLLLHKLGFIFDPKAKRHIYAGTRDKRDTGEEGYRFTYCKPVAADTHNTY